MKTNIIKSKVIKSSEKEESDRIFNYPFDAVEEALSNAVYHRNYELRDPIEVRILPKSIEIISFNGVDPSLKQSDFERGIIRARRYRNRRIGEFLKELRLTEGRGTGIPTIIRALETNGSGKPKFDTDEPRRSHFLIEIPIHQDFIKVENELKGSVSPQVTPQVTPQVQKMLDVMSGEMSRQDIQYKLKLSDKKNFNETYLKPALDLNLVEMTIPDKPQSSIQKYRLTELGKSLKNS